MQFSHSSEIIVITLLAALVNGALGYGFSSITVPLALLFLTNRILNPALVLIEVGLNAYVLWVNRAGLTHVWRRLLPIAIGLAPGVIVGTLIVAQVRPDWLKFGTFALLLPLILVQAAGYRHPIRGERAFGYPFGYWRRAAVFGHHHFGAAARRVPEQSRTRQTGVPGGSWIHPPGRIQLHRGGVRLRRTVRP